MSKSLKGDLIAAKALIDTPEKWGKEIFYTTGETRCVIGALARAQNDTVNAAERSDAYRALCAAIPENGGAYDYLHEFNDDPDTTHADIMALFDRAIEAAS